MTISQQLDFILKNVPTVMYYEKDVEDYSLRYYRRQISDIRATIDCEGWNEKWQKELDYATSEAYKLYCAENGTPNTLQFTDEEILAVAEALGSIKGNVADAAGLTNAFDKFYQARHEVIQRDLYGKSENLNN